MANLPSVATTYFTCPLASISDGTDTWVCVKNYRHAWNYVLLQEDRIGNHDPVQACGAFRGTIEFEFLANSESGSHDWVTPASGQLTEKTFTITQLDIAAADRIWTVKARINEYEETMRDADFIRVRIRGALTDEPTEVT